ncbi:hypothetical protein Daus18300_001871 [Diaporthe australafricana]|uniref:Uncharacterized protein n=1 Tax=Diaporthe australafricana TaxID=127596 RepID=A0ABR3XTI8_9PEZI
MSRIFILGLVGAAAVQAAPVIPKVRTPAEISRDCSVNFFPWRPECHVADSQGDTTRVGATPDPDPDFDVGCDWDGVSPIPENCHVNMLGTDIVGIIGHIFDSLGDYLGGDDDDKDKKPRPPPSTNFVYCNGNEDIYCHSNGNIHFKAYSNFVNCNSNEDIYCNSNGNVYFEAHNNFEAHDNFDYYHDDFEAHDNFDYYHNDFKAHNNFIYCNANTNRRPQQEYTLKRSKKKKRDLALGLGIGLGVGIPSIALLGFIGHTLTLIKGFMAEGGSLLSDSVLDSVAEMAVNDIPDWAGANSRPPLNHPGDILDDMTNPPRTQVENWLDDTLGDRTHGDPGPPNEGESGPPNEEVSYPSTDPSWYQGESLISRLDTLYDNMRGNGYTAQQAREIVEQFGHKLDGAGSDAGASSGASEVVDAAADAAAEAVGNAYPPNGGETGSGGLPAPNEAVKKALLDVLKASYDFWPQYANALYDALVQENRKSPSKALIDILANGPPPTMEPYRDISYPYRGGKSLGPGKELLPMKPKREGFCADVSIDELYQSAKADGKAVSDGLARFKGDGKDASVTWLNQNPDEASRLLKAVPIAVCRFHINRDSVRMTGPGTMGHEETVKMLLTMWKELLNIKPLSPEAEPLFPEKDWCQPLTQDERNQVDSLDKNWVLNFLGVFHVVNEAGVEATEAELERMIRQPLTQDERNQVDSLDKRWVLDVPDEFDGTINMPQMAYSGGLKPAPVTDWCQTLTQDERNLADSIDKKWIIDSVDKLIDAVDKSAHAIKSGAEEIPTVDPDPDPIPISLCRVQKALESPTISEHDKAQLGTAKYWLQMAAGKVKLANGKIREAMRALSDAIHAADPGSDGLKPAPSGTGGLARHILNVAEEVRSITSADADEIARAIIKGHDLPVEKE